MADLPKISIKRKKRVGRGYGSGKGGHTVGRGQKGQKSRSRLHILFEGTKTKKSLLRRLPLKRGKDKFKAKLKPVVVSFDQLNLLKDGTTVNIETLIKAGIITLDDAKKYGVKVLASGKLTKKLTINLPTSKGAAQKILDIGGKVSK